MKKPQRVAVLNISQIIVENRVRKDFSDLPKIKNSIEKNGLIHPLAVMDRNDGFLLLAGETRLRAVKELGWTEVQCNIFTEQLSLIEIDIIEDSENLDRKDYTVEERAFATKRLHENLVKVNGAAPTGPRSEANPGWAIADTAKYLNVSSATVSQDLKMARAFDAVPGVGANFKTRNDALNFIAKAEKKGDVARAATIAKTRIANTPEELLRKKLIDSFILQDFFQGVKSVPDQSIDLIELDPPYGIDLKAVAKNGELSTIDYNEIDAKEYPNFLTLLLSECSRVLKPTGWLLMWYAPHPWHALVVDTINNSNMETRGLPALWVKLQGNAQTMQPNLYLGRAYEPFLYARKQQSLLAKPGSIDIFPINGIPTNHKVHPTERPVQLIERILDVFVPPNSTILIPFLGSGNTLLAASNKLCNAFGFELSKEYKDSFVMKVENGEVGKFRSTLIGEQQ